MSRIAIVSIFLLGSAVLASAGQIQVGGATGLKSVYITSGTGCAGGAGNCVAGSVGTATEQGYDNVLFSGATSNSGATTPLPYSTYSPTASNSGTITDSAADGGAGVTFSMINNGAGNNFWDLPSSGNGSMTIPIGVFGVTDVWTMLNTVLADAGPTDRDAIVVFNFGTTSNAATTDAVSVKLNNSAPATAGQDENAVNCGSPSAACGGLSSPSSGPLGSTTINGVTVDTDTIYSFGFTNATGAYAGATGNVVLDDQGFFFNDLSLATLGVGDTNLNTYLVSITIKEPSLTGNTGEGLALSAITLDTATPEPSTILTLLAGLGAIAFGGYRRSRA